MPVVVVGRLGILPACPTKTQPRQKGNAASGLRNALAVILPKRHNPGWPAICQALMAGTGWISMMMFRDRLSRM